MDTLITKIYKSSKTILTNKDLALLWNKNNKDELNDSISYYTKKKSLIRLTRGVFAKDHDYDPKELGTSIYAPSYVSFETVLRESGVIFQHYDTLFIASKWPKTVKIDKHIITFRKLKDSVLFSPTGIINKENYSIATKERAFLDMIYLFPNYYFDNLDSIDWEKCNRIVKIYNNKQLVKRLNRYYKNHAQ